MKISWFGNRALSPIPVYPGGKNKLMTHIVRHIPNNIDTVYSPFCGSCAVEIYLAKKGIQIHASDNLEHLIMLFRASQMNKQKFMDHVNKHNDNVTKEKWVKYHHTVKYHTHDHDIFDIAAMTFLLFVYSLNGISFETQMGGAVGYFKSCNSVPYHRHLIRLRLNKMAKTIPQNMSFCCKSYEEIIPARREKNELLYCDPPYDSPRYLYGLERERKTKDVFSHEKLARLLKQQNNWILSYSGTDKIKALYSEYEIMEYKSHVMIGRYGERHPISEVIILSHDIADQLKSHDLLSYL